MTVTVMSLLQSRRGRRTHHFARGPLLVVSCCYPDPSQGPLDPTLNIQFRSISGLRVFSKPNIMLKEVPCLGVGGQNRSARTNRTTNKQDSIWMSQSETRITTWRTRLSRSLSLSLSLSRLAPQRGAAPNLSLSLSLSLSLFIST